MEIIHAKKPLAGLSLLSAAVLATPTLAQEAQRSGFVLEEITVTARKVEENLQEVPIAVTAFSGDALERRQIDSSDDIGKITPNLQFTNNAPLAGNNNSSVIFIRGVGQISARANTDPGVGLYIDDVYMGQSVGGTMEMRDIAGVQVLRGPQGTLFGRNTIGGAVLISTTQPGDELGGKIRVGAGEDGLMELFGAVDVPISDTVKTRFTAGTKQQDGYVKRVSDGTDLGDTNNYTLTAKLLLEPTESFTANLALDYTEADENGSPLVFGGYNNNTDVNDTSIDAAWFGANASVGAGCPDAWIALPGPPGRPVTTADGSTLDVSGLTTTGGGPRGYTGESADARCVNNQWNAGPYATNGTYPVESTLENQGVSLKLEYALNEEITLKSISSYRELEWVGKRDADNTPFTILHTDFHSDGDQFSQELQFNYESDSLTGVAGLYYYEEEVTDILSVQVGDRGPGFSCGVGTDRCHLDSDNNITDNQSWAAFGQLTYDFTEQLSGTLGVRYTEETKASIPDQFDYAAPDDKYLPKKRYEADFSATTVSANLSYRLGETSMVYGSYSEGFKGGGWNSTFNFALTESDLEAGHQFDQEEVKTYELGFKSDLTDNLRINGAIFSSDYTDLQFTYRVFIAPWFFNAGEASIDGAELEVTYVPSDSWIIEGGLGYLDTSVDKAVEIVVPGRPVSAGVEEGNQLPFAPELQGNLGIGYNLALGSLQISPRVDLTYSDSVYFDAANTDTIAQSDSYSLVDLSVAVEDLNANWKVVVGVNNATDEEYRVSGNSSLTSGSGYAEVAYARPRVIFASATWEF
ncbi:TonB-dependent receptor [Halioxenophilus sp. WMMB6]|uniref:TonB-dependent receptor n=1 Tax=Halioxenophilus sp. WMMB6 TaxID=3073815 RepID=UPI00295E52E7|nr:TonB-dependent receptor [Halioxenophilus sp. WMMB6]